MSVRRVAAALAIIVPLACTESEAPTESQIGSLETATESGGLYATATSIVVSIDVRPTTAANRVPLHANGTIPVALLGTTEFDISTVDASSLAFGPAGGPWTAAIHDLGVPGVLDDHSQDMNGDGVADLVSHYRVPDLAFVDGDEFGCLVGYTLDGSVFEGCDPITTRP